MPKFMRYHGEKNKIFFLSSLVRLIPSEERQVKGQFAMHEGAGPPGPRREDLFEGNFFCVVIFWYISF